MTGPPARTHLKRLTRKTICFSKSDDMRPQGYSAGMRR
ncbi:hypothetical protein BHJ80_24705 (plasmid) [Escherichia coli]|nr:hypothetical protein BHJ80_24705 [Escherichia coli]